MILGINASGRKAVRNDQGILVKGVTDELLKHILKETGEPYEYVHLGGKTIKGYHIPRIPQETYQKATALARRLGLVVKNNA